MIIAVGFKVNNERAVRFRKWAGQVIKDYTIQGWAMDKERLKKGHMFTDEYFERQLQNIRVPLVCFFKPYRTKCTGRFIDILQHS